ncbi:MAG: hypothetical protein JNM07_03290 [Phycisphaerae bacterium]|nr:hypothetical protein [Phycisphaerae bacterium]
MTRWESAPGAPGVLIVLRAARDRWLLLVVFVVLPPVRLSGPLMAPVRYWNPLDRVRKHVRLIVARGVPAEQPRKLGCAYATGRAEPRPLPVRARVGEFSGGRPCSRRDFGYCLRTVLKRSSSRRAPRGVRTPRRRLSSTAPGT